MTGPVPPRPPEDWQGGEPEGRIAVGRALVLLVVAVVVGILCLQVGARPPAATTTAAGATTSTTSPPGSTTTTSTTVAPPNPAVKVLVANGGAVNGAAGYFTSKLHAAGWTTLTATNATPVTASGVYYATGQQASAARIASSLGLPTTAVHPIATAPTVAGDTGVGVLVVVGPDLSSKVPSGAATGSSTGSGTAAG